MVKIFFQRNHVLKPRQYCVYRSMQIWYSSLYYWTEYEIPHKGMNDFDRVYGTFINDIKVLYRTGAPWWGIIHFGRLRILERPYCHVISHHVMYLESLNWLLINLIALERREPIWSTWYFVLWIMHTDN